MTDSSVAPGDRDRQFSRLVQAITGYAIYILGPDGEVRSANTGASRVEGFSETQILGRHFSIFFTAEDQDSGKPAQALETARVTGRFMDEGWRVRRDGTRYWASVVLEPIYDDAAALVGFARVIRDSTVEREARLELQRTERALRLFNESVVHYAMYALDTNGNVTSWNPGAERTKGYAKTEIIGQHFSVFFTAEDQANGKPMLALETARQTGRFEDEGWRVRKDGQRFWASVVLEPIIDYDGVLVGFAKITRDITERLALDAAKDELLKIQQTERVRAEARVREVEGELIQIHRFTAVGEMASTLAHEINQPLTAITNYLKGCARILDRMDGEHVPALRGAVNEAANQALRAGDIIRHMRQFLARGEIEPAAEDVPALLAESVHVALLAVPPGYVEIVFDLAEPSRLVMVDRVQTQQVLLNLIRNAIEAMAESPRRLLVLKTGEPMPDGLVKISVADTGTGLLPHVRDNLFQTFVSSKENGMGLGLSICRTIVESHGGRIWVETSSEEGTTFSFTLRTL